MSAFNIIFSLYQVNNMISYRPLWDQLERCGISQYDLIRSHLISSGSLNALRKNQYVRTTTINSLCSILHCEPFELVEFYEVADDEVSQALSGTGKA